MFSSSRSTKCPVEPKSETSVYTKLYVFYNASVEFWETITWEIFLDGVFGTIFLACLLRTDSWMWVLRFFDGLQHGPMDFASFHYTTHSPFLGEPLCIFYGQPGGIPLLLHHT